MIGKERVVFARVRDARKLMMPASLSGGETIAGIRIATRCISIAQAITHHARMMQSSCFVVGE